MLAYGSVCSGIEAATVAWHPLGWRPSFFSEIEAAPRAVLQHRHPEVPLHGDFTTIREGQYGAIDLLVGGTPCQSFSVAGLRGGLADDRGNLALQYLSLARRLRPRWLVWENVPGVLSSNGGRDFGSILGGMVELGYGFAYRVLDAQYVRVDGFGRAVPQRRRRVFVVGHLGDWRRPAAVLLERACLRGDPAPRREAGEDAARCLTRGSGGGQRYDWETENFVAGCLNGLSEYGADVPTLRAKGGDAAGGSEALIAFDTTQITSAANYSRPQPGDPCHPLAAGAHAPAIAFSCKDHGADATDEGATPTLRAMSFDRSHANAGGQLAVALGHNGGPSLSEWFEWAVRRLTPRECERLQGFTDDYTLVPWRGGLLPDGPRYKALGNSMAVNVMRWIGHRIATVDGLPSQMVEAA
ncbi:DNA cytosine methyltransferase [Methylorubrum populi]|uniref:Cytosine-specific methyltransferase n=1 Tax=Methylorubrum populi TaxID=223967 RepID=A0A833J9Y8_9HYPH|nr:DNA cytosine methyltransferase [Methylorubrum populi]KAB7788015.1 DNA-cytosine methyltransferase [Methylorubrum populi]